MKGTLLWDFDGTLAYRDGMWRGCLTDILVAEDPSTTVTDEDIRPYVNEGFPWHEPKKEHTDIKTSDEWWAVMHPLFVNAYKGVGVDDGLANKCASLVRNEFINTKKWHLFEDTIPALTKLEQEGWKHVIVSNHVPELEALVSHLGIHEYVQEVFTSALVGYEKPHQKMFEHVLSHIQSNDDMWMIGDSVAADINGAASVGIKGILVRKPNEDADVYYENLLEVVEKLR